MICYTIITYLPTAGTSNLGSQNQKDFNAHYPPVVRYLSILLNVGTYICQYLCTPNPPTLYNLY